MFLSSVFQSILLLLINHMNDDCETTSTIEITNTAAQERK